MRSPIRRLLLIGSLLTVFSGCGYQGSYRYPCQNPAKWGSVECLPPACLASDTCTKDLIPEEVSTSVTDISQP